MEEKGSKIYRFFSQVLILFAIDILILMLLAALVGNLAQGMSSIYQFGAKGLSSITMLQFLLSSATIILLKSFFHSEKRFQRLTALQRTIFMQACILLIHILYIIVFGWFSLNNYLAWIGFLVLFAGGFALGLLVMVLKIRLDNRQYDKLLSQYKEKHEEEDNE